MTKQKTSMTQRAAKLLSKGKNVTVDQLRKIGFARPHNAIYALREAGYTIYTNKIKKNGEIVTAYRQAV